MRVDSEGTVGADIEVPVEGFHRRFAVSLLDGISMEFVREKAEENSERGEELGQLWLEIERW